MVGLEKVFYILTSSSSCVLLLLSPGFLHEICGMWKGRHFHSELHAKGMDLVAKVEEDKK